MLHEFKHILDHPYKNRLQLSEAQVERLADYFAACVLMPKSKIKWAWGSGQQRIDQLARGFGVSEPAMTYRLHQLGLLERTRRCIGTNITRSAA
jgi:Zn-dependent peptidase ImmA (M78 family)